MTLWCRLVGHRWTKPELWIDDNGWKVNFRYCERCDKEASDVIERPPPHDTTLWPER